MIPHEMYQRNLFKELEMTLVDLIVVLVVLIVAQFVALPWGVAIFVTGALIVERLLRGERLP